jgi:ferritin-like metal-binding protein YciE
MAKLTTLNDLFPQKLRFAYDAEQRLTKALPKMAKAAASPELKQAFETHLKETETHVDRDERVFGIFDASPNADTNTGMKGLISAGDDVIDLNAEEPVKDAALIAAAQEVEHYEISAYGTLCEWAKVLHKPEAAQLLEFTLQDEKNADQKLTQVAGRLNFQAVSPRS